MKKILVGLAAAGLMLMGQGCPSGPSSSGPAPEAVAPTGAKATVEITAKGYNPSELRVKAGTEVTFINKDSAKHWPASDVHPTHNVCAGFDAKKPLGQGDSYAFVFGVKKECPYHDHLNPVGGIKGKVIVE